MNAPRTFTGKSLVIRIENMLNIFCQRMAKPRVAETMKINPKNTWQAPPNNENRNRRREIFNECRRPQPLKQNNLRLRLLSISKLVISKQGQLLEVRPERGVLKAFLAWYTSTRDGA